MPLLGFSFSQFLPWTWRPSQSSIIDFAEAKSHRFREYSYLDEAPEGIEADTRPDVDLVAAISRAQGTIIWHSTSYGLVHTARPNFPRLFLSLLNQRIRAAPLQPYFILPAIESVSPVMRSLAEHIFDAPISDLNLLLRYLRNEDESDRLASAQLNRELQHHVAFQSKGALHPGVKDSPLYTRLPAEVRHQIFANIVRVPESIHIYPVKGNSRLGYRLSRCPDSLLNLDSGTCSCESGFRPPPTPPAYLDTELLLVSRDVRREVLDLTFLYNHFTFTSTRDLANFTESFTACAAKMQSIRLFQRLSDHYLSYYAASNTAKARAQIGHLENLELNCYLDDLSYYETCYHDGFITEVLPLAFPRPENVKVIVRPNGLWGNRADKGLLDAVEIVQKKLEDVFDGKWASVKEVPLSEPPKKRVPECEKEPMVKRGILALVD